MQSDPKDFLAELAEAIRWPVFLSEGACVGVSDPTLFDDEDAQKTIEAKKICKGCPVQTDCADWGIKNEDSGIWGGMDAKDRQKRRGKAKFITVEKRREDLNWLRDMLEDKPVAELAAKYGKTERTIYRWRNRERKRIERLGYSPFWRR